MKDTFVGMFFMFISAMLYIAHFVVCGFWASRLTSWNTQYGKMGTVTRELGYAPIVLVWPSLGIGVFYFIRGERKGQENTKETSS